MNGCATDRKPTISWYRVLMGCTNIYPTPCNVPTYTKMALRWHRWGIDRSKCLSPNPPLPLGALIISVYSTFETPYTLACWYSYYSGTIPPTLVPDLYKTASVNLNEKHGRYIQALQRQGAVSFECNFCEAYPFRSLTNYSRAMYAWHRQAGGLQ